jgi:hypothetical protein
VEVDPDVDIAAANIQRLFRGSAARKKAMREREEELVYIGMKPPKQNRCVHVTLCILYCVYIATYTLVKACSVQRYCDRRPVWQAESVAQCCDFSWCTQAQLVTAVNQSTLAVLQQLRSSTAFTYVTCCVLQCHTCVYMLDCVCSNELERQLAIAYRKRKQEQTDNREGYERALEDLR